MLVHYLFFPPHLFFFTEHYAGVWGHLKLINKPEGGHQCWINHVEAKCSVNK